MHTLGTKRHFSKLQVDVVKTKLATVSPPEVEQTVAEPEQIKSLLGRVNSGKTIRFFDSK